MLIIIVLSINILIKDILIKDIFSTNHSDNDPLGKGDDHIVDISKC